MLTEIYEEAGVPAGVFNMLVGSGSVVGETIVNSPVVRAVSFTGSNEVGGALYAKAAQRGAKVTLVTTTDRSVTAAVDVIRVETAAEMEHAVLTRSDACDIVVMAAAVADFRPAETIEDKIAKTGREGLALAERVAGGPAPCSERGMDRRGGEGQPRRLVGVVPAVLPGDVLGRRESRAGEDAVEPERSLLDQRPELQLAFLRDALS